ncbi:hypothetical protein EDEG_02283 [Edhazardia aedis USNM 41457]|uniref:Uncharacterized protein n=1 Tax=Edhazardia aedis (strain USNM 41457) TaxID=1003232 RepID=J8ZUL7_EDHAE|nr:hypothetical protein EDEG_02283 [Edhazardia aedis USNM 41457]|eukprot:EJW03373.1 hypothetical protein EDEG_02283 [Edhazardia aedis USNM 41457]
MFSFLKNNNNCKKSGRPRGRPRKSNFINFNINFGQKTHQFKPKDNIFCHNYRKLFFPFVG